MTWMLAVDFGTSNTAAAVRRGEDVRPLHLSGQGFTMPSAVALVEDGFRVGTAALNARLTSPETFEWQPKSLIGSGPVLLGDRTLTPGALVSEVLAHVHSTAMTHGDGSPPARTVLTHPVAWTQRQIGELVDAAVVAGFDRQRMVVMNEPVAAAMRYASDDLSAGDRIAVIDWGGGTCDVAIVEYVDARRGSAFAVRSHSGDPHLGGSHLDARLYDHVLQRLRDEDRGDLVAELQDPARLSARLTLADVVRRAKEDLSTYESVTIPVQAGAEEATLVVSREEYEGLIEDEIRRVVHLWEQAVERDHGAGVGRILLTGGASQTPALAHALEASTGVPLEHRGDPKLVVAEGALVAQIPPARRPLPPAPPRPAPPQVQSSAPTPTPTPAPRPQPSRAPAAPTAPQPQAPRAPSQAALATAESGSRRPGVVIAVVVAVIVVLALIVFGLVRLTGGGGDPSPAGSADLCWNGEEPDDAGECRDFRGDAALAWAFPVDEHADAECEIADRYWECRWADHASSMFEAEHDNDVKLSEENLRDRARVILGTDVDVEVQPVNALRLGGEGEEGEVIGRRWDGVGRVDGVAVLQLTYYEYDALPYRALLYTHAEDGRELTTAEQDGHEELVLGEIVMRSAEEIERARTGEPG